MKWVALALVGLLVKFAVDVLVRTHEHNPDLYLPKLFILVGFVVLVVLVLGIPYKTPSVNADLALIKPEEK
jgi:hypothetical protein